MNTCFYSSHLFLEEEKKTRQSKGCRVPTGFEEVKHVETISSNINKNYVITVEVKTTHQTDGLNKIQVTDCHLPPNLTFKSPSFFLL